jgi:hypothetical protein
MEKSHPGLRKEVRKYTLTLHLGCSHRLGARQDRAHHNVLCVWHVILGITQSLSFLICKIEYLLYKTYSCRKEPQLARKSPVNHSCYYHSPAGSHAVWDHEQAARDRQ